MSILNSLKSIHKDIERSYIQEKRAIADKRKAMEIEYGFQGILYYFKRSSTNFLQPAQKDIVQDLLINHQIPAQLFSTFTSGVESEGIGASGQRFEEELEMFFKHIFETEGNLPIKVGDRQVYTGTTITVGNTKAMPQMKVEISKNTSEQLNKKIEKMSLGSVKEGSIVRQAAASGVIDLTVPNSIKSLGFEYSDATKRFLNLLKGANITAKCYTNTKTISSGNTGLYRMLSSVLKSINRENDIDMYYRYFRGSSSKLPMEAKKHLSDMTFAYQLLGLGQYIDINGTMQQLNTTDFLIVFDKSTQQIKVRSTKALALEYLQGNSIARHPVIKLI